MYIDELSLPESPSLSRIVLIVLISQKFRTTSELIIKLNFMKYQKISYQNNNI